MAMRALRLRRALGIFSLNPHRLVFQPTASPNPLSHCPNAIQSSQSRTLHKASTTCPGQFRCFSEGRKWKLYKEGDEITEDTVLFEGCDFNHWLITVDFPKDPKPSAEEMVATYERICAQGLNISIEEAKKKIYACSTTTYQGFQAIMTEAESEKFKDVPGVVFVLPDSYIDPVNKEYGGDKYENGVIFPRPPPYIAQREQRRERNQRYDRPRNFQNYNQNQNPPYNQPRPMQGEGRNFGPPNYSQQDPNFAMRRDHGPPHNYTPQQHVPQGQYQQPPMNNRDNTGRGWDQNQMNGGSKAPFETNYNQVPPPNFQSQNQNSFLQGNHSNYRSQEQGGPWDSRNQSNYGSHGPPPAYNRTDGNFPSPSAGYDGQSYRDGYGQSYQNERQHQMEQPQHFQDGNYRGGQ